MQVDDGKMQEFQQKLVETITKLESAMNLLKDGKEIPTHNMLLGIKQKLYLIFSEIKKLNENNKN